MESQTQLLYGGKTRKQNVACDNCRSKKIRCKRLTTVEICQQCAAKSISCTSVYVDQLQNKPRKNRIRQRGIQPADVVGARPDSAGGSSNDSDSAPLVSPTQSPIIPQSNLGPAEGSRSSTVHPTVPVPLDDMSMFAFMPPVSSVYLHSHVDQSQRDAVASQTDLVKFMFSPIPVKHHNWGYSDTSSMDMARSGQCDLWEEMSGSVWDEPPSGSHLDVWSNEVQLQELCNELVESFFSIINTRFPLLNPETFLSRFTSPMTDQLGPLPHPLLAVVLAWGAKFTDHAVLANDRNQCSVRDGNGQFGRSRSRLAQLLVIRAREVVESNKAHRVATIVNVQSLVLLEALVGQYSAYHLAAASRHMVKLRNQPSDHLSGVPDETTLAQSVVSISVSFESVFHRLNPCIFDTAHNYSSSPPATPHGDEDFWLVAAHSGSHTCRKLCSELWLPRVAAHGIAMSTLRDFIHHQSTWRDKFLSRMGVPADWPESWDFVAAIKACSTDIFYHSLWLVVDGAIQDFGIQEARQVESGQRQGGMFDLEVDHTKERIKQEAMHGAMRIAALVAVLLEHGYLRLDPLVLYMPMYKAGLYLATRGRDESRICVAGLKQYSLPYPQMWDLALEVENAFRPA